MKILKTIFMIFLFSFIVGEISFAQTAMMNEVFSRGTTTNPDWIEIYNPSSSVLNISTYKIYDTGGQSGSKPKKTFPAGALIPAYGYYVIVTDDGSPSAFGLSSGGEKVWLEDSLGVVVDSCDIAAMPDSSTSYSRTPDGNSLWKIVSKITRGNSNVVLTQILLPQYIQGVNGTNNNRIPFAFRIKLENLAPNTTYHYINQVVLSTESSSTSGAGNIFFVYQDSIVKTSSPSMSTGPYGVLTTDANGSHEGWYITEPTGNATRFVPGNYIFMRIRLNNGAAGTSPVIWATTSDSVKVVSFGTASDNKLGTGIYGHSYANQKDFVFLYDNVNGTGRPLSGAMIESDGISLAAFTNFPPFYKDSVDAISGTWGTIIPNQLSNGVKRIERRLFSDGSLFPVVATSINGSWPSGANTVNPTGGLNAIGITKSDAPLSFINDVKSGSETLSEFSISQNYPNPFNPVTLISYQLPAAGFVTLKVYDVLGNEVSNLVDAQQEAGNYQVTFDGKTLASGIYLCRLQAGEFVSMIKMNLLK